ncbi:restriction endonuclease subunit S [Staphylococcus sp. Marseille-Q6910]|uniref:restriction endonuclease subunit S n=1 Tax=Staphylococcus sp. Marseille-Q6910 TaxID=2937990 RepID=UPI00203A4E16|nr:restriction endonuclease subunit S [Staphylococcus sp. Marseille-Q6910]
MTNEKNVPELRFPEYNEKWEEKKLGEIVDFSKGKLLGKKDLVENDGFPCILYGELYTKYGPIINSVISRTNVDKDKLKKGEKNQILIPSSGETTEDIATASALNINGDVYIGGDLNILTPKEKDGRFISLSLNGVNKWNIAKFAQGKTVVHLYNNDLRKLNINLPTKIEEQQKIGVFFSKLDRQIELEEKKLDLLEQQKKGYMQKIFSQELRFKDENGNDYPEWEIKKLMQIAKVKTGSKNVQDNIQDGKYKFFDRSVEVKYLNTFDFDETAIIYPGEGSKFLPRYFSGKYSLHQRAYSIYDININNNYLYYYLSLQNNHFLKYAVGSTVKSLRMSGFDKLKVMVPKNSEQEKIGSFFKNLDEFIEKQANKVELLKKRKQSFLQKMFV